MANMSYCRFENTLSDLQDCAEHLGDELKGTELQARNRLILLCIEIAESYSYQKEEDDEDEPSDSV